MKKMFLALFFVIFVSTCLQAQNYAKYMQQGKNFYNKKDFISALQRFDLAFEFAVNNGEKSDAKNWKNKSREKISEQQDAMKSMLTELEKQKQEAENQRNEAEKLRIIAENQKEESEIQKQEAIKAKKESDSLLYIATKWQRQYADAAFDKAVKEKDDKWEGFYQMVVKEKDDEIEKGLNKIDTLNFRKSYLPLIPDLVLNCHKLKHINLIGNNYLSWKNSEEVLDSLNPDVTMYLTLNKLSDVPEKYRSRINGVELAYGFRDKIPQDVLEIKDLEYFSMYGDFSEMVTLEKWPEEFFELKKLKTIELYQCFIPEFPSEIGNLKNLVYLKVQRCSFKSLPEEISKLKKLQYLDLSGNNFSKQERERIKKLVPWCKVIF